MAYSVGTQYAGVSVMLAMGLLTLWLLLTGRSIKDFANRAILSLSGHLRTRPDPWFEAGLRAAFADFDRELALILQDRSCPFPGRADGACHRDFPRG